MEKTLAQKMGDLSFVGNKACDIMEEKKLNIAEDEKSQLYAMADGHTYNAIVNLIQGRCSIKESLEWSLERIEKYIESQYALAMKIIGTETV